MIGKIQKTADFRIKIKILFERNNFKAQIFIKMTF